MAADINLQAILKFVDQSGQGIESAKQNLSSLNDVTGALTTGLAALGITASVAGVVQLGKLGAESLRARSSLATLMGGVERSETTIRKLADATGGEISNTELATRATRLYTDGLADNEQQMVRIAAAAERMGDAMGLSASNALTSLTTALETRSPRALRALGLDVDAVTASYKAMQAAGTDLTDQQLYMEVVLTEIETKFSGVQGKSYDTADAFDRINVSTSNLKDALGEGLLPALVPVLDILTKLLNKGPELAAGREEMARAVLLESDSWEEYEHKLWDVIDQYKITAQQRRWLTSEGVIATRETFNAMHATALLSDEEEHLQEAIAAFIQTGGSAPGLYHGIAKEAGAAAANVVAYVEAQHRVNEQYTSKSAETLSKAYSQWQALGDVTRTGPGGSLAEDVRGRMSSEAAARRVELYAIRASVPPGYREGFASEHFASEGIRQAEDVYSKWNDARREVEFTSAAINEIPATFRSHIEHNFDDAAEQAGAIVGYLERLKSRYRVVIDYTAPVNAGGGAMPREYANGTTFAEQGIAIVGERGPELVYLPRGAQVVPNQNVRNYSIGGDTYNVQDSVAISALKEMVHRARMRAIDARF